jgi:alpha-glucosidase
MQAWMQGAVVYQIYPRSFYDAGDSGVGNLKGIIEKLDYLGGSPESLGVTAIWISPIFTSPMADFGYDVSNYTGIDPIFGTLTDFKKLIKEAHKRGIKVILDFVPNHSSDEHPWFVESKSSLNNPKRDWYTWRDPAADGGAPNNWISVFDGPAWQFDELTGQYYLHSFLAKQPDLNWDNPAVREAMKAAMRFWLDLGVDGFRVDAVDWLSKDSQLRDDTLKHHCSKKLLGTEYDAYKHIFSRDGPHVYERLNEMTDVLKEYDGRFMITEAHPETDDKVAGYLQYYRGVNPHLSAPFNFEGIHLPWQAASYCRFVDSFQAVMEPGYTPIYTTGNHDESRVASRIGSAAARTAAMMLLTLPGMAFVYYGEELGMLDVPIAPHQRRDPFVGRGRDPQRTPMLWSSKHYAGFSGGKPWLPIAPGYFKLNVTAQTESNTSMLNLYKQLIGLRNQSAAIKEGTYRSVIRNEAVYAYERTLGTKKLLIVLNFSGTVQRVTQKKFAGTILLSTYLDSTAESINELIRLRPNEGLIVEVKHD